MFRQVALCIATLIVIAAAPMMGQTALTNPLIVKTSFNFSSAQNAKNYYLQSTHRSGDNIYWTYYDSISSTVVSTTRVVMSLALSAADLNLSKSVTLKNSIGTVLATKTCTSYGCEVTLPNSIWNNFNFRLESPRSTAYTLEITLKTGVVVIHRLVLTSH